MDLTMDFIFEASSTLLELMITCRDDNEKKSLIKNFLDKLTRAEDLEKIKEFEDGLEWMNTTTPLTLNKDLKGKIIILDFFTYCCINCMHILPDLKALEETFPVEKGLVVVGVHSAKFTNERNTQNIINAVQRYDISHPVINDSCESLWKELRVSCWPTLIVIAPDLKPLLLLQGEGHKDLLLLFIEEGIRFYTEKKLLSNHSLPQIQITKSFHSTSSLSYPGKVASFKQKFAVSDTGNHRIILTSFSNEETTSKPLIIGGTDAGFKNGGLSEARFHSPQGVVFLDANTIIVADTENHAIRKIDLITATVETLVGTGSQGYDKTGGKQGNLQIISSPWDVCTNTEKTIVFIAMAGTHQIWALFLEDASLWGRKHSKGTCAAVAGSGMEENRNNSYPMRSGFAQPSGICIAPEKQTMYIADSESSSIRAIDLRDGKVMAVAGGAKDPRNLFDYGDKDGKGINAKLQHPLGVAWNPHNCKLYVTDTYNHKIKEIDVENMNCVSSDIVWKFDEPSGLCMLEEKLLIADTNNHEIVCHDFTTHKTELVKIEAKPVLSNGKKNIVKEEKLEISPSGGTLDVDLAFNLPDGCSLSSGAPSKWSLSVPDSWKVIKNCKSTFSPSEKFQFAVPGKNEISTCDLSAKLESMSTEKKFPSTNDSVLCMECSVYFCNPNGTCLQRNYSVILSLSYVESAGSEISFNFAHDVDL